MKSFFWLAILASPLLLEGCYAPLMEGAGQGYDVVRRDSLQAETASGDPVAQYKLGETYCCQGGGPMDKVSVYDNNKATYWYCQSARQNYGPAQLRLAQLYSGDPVHGINIAQRASALVGTPETNLGVALMWASVAASHGVEGAIALRDKLTEQATDKERARASALMKNWRAAPCRWADVIPSASVPGQNQPTPAR
jgi:TPR repeat protein